MTTHVPNADLRLQIAEMIHKAGEGHIPSAFSIVDIVAALYGKFLKFESKNPSWEGRDYFVLSKGHGCAALYVVLARHGFITKKDLESKGTYDGILGGHPDSIKVPGAEASTGSLGHGIVTAMGIALGLKILGKPNRVIALIGDGESNEGTVWETALVAPNLRLGNFCVIVDNNHSAEQILPLPNMRQKWQAFGWDTYEIDGHNEREILSAMRSIDFSLPGRPHIVIANTVKGKGVSFLEGHGVWHHKIPDKETMTLVREELTCLP